MSNMRSQEDIWRLTVEPQRGFSGGQSVVLSSFLTVHKDPANMSVGTRTKFIPYLRISSASINAKINRVSSLFFVKMLPPRKYEEQFLCKSCQALPINTMEKRPRRTHGHQATPAKAPASRRQRASRSNPEGTIA